MAGSSNLTFNDWNTVAQYYGQDVANLLQQNNVPLSQVGQTVQNSQPTFGPGGTTIQSGSGGSVLQNLQNQFSSQNQSQPQQAPFNPSDPRYTYSQLGAAVSGQPVVINPNPSEQPINAQGGIYSGRQSPYVGTSTATMPQGPWSNVPGLAGGMAPTNATQHQLKTDVFAVPKPTQGNITPMTPAGAVTNPQQSGTPFASPPPAPTVNMAQISQNPGVPPSAGYQEPGPMWGMVTNKNNLPNAVHAGNFPGPDNPYAGGGTTPGSSAGAIALGKAMNSGGRVPGQGSTDTVPAMLTPGEFVMNKNAVQQIGVQNLQAMNQQPQHFQDGGSVQFQPNTQGLNPPPSNAANNLAMAQALALWGNYPGANGPNQPVTGSSYPMGPGNVRMEDDSPPGRNTYYAATKTPTGNSPSLNYYRTGDANAGYNAAANQNQPPPPSYTDFAPRASLVAPPAGYGPAPRAELVGLPAGQGEAYDPKTYGINPGPTGGQTASAIAGGVGAAGQAIAQGFENNAKLSWTPQRSAIPSAPSYNAYYNRNELNPELRVT